MLVEKKYAVYYREIPASLEYFIVKDGRIKYNKDGTRTYDDGHKCPRLSIIVEPTGNEGMDRDRIRRFESLLNELHANNQIVGYSG